MARPTELNLEVQGSIATALRLGVTRSSAAVLGGISVVTFRSWLKRGHDAKPGDEAYVEFLHAVQLAEAQAEKTMVTLLFEHAIKKKDFRAIQLFLERRVSEWQPKSNMSVEGEAKKLADIAAQLFGPEGAEKLLAAYTGGAGG